jgi:GTP-binding protein
MKFIDEAKIYIRAGHGGRGCVSFRREKFVPRGGPDGGDGGKGGDVVVRTSASARTLLDLKYRQHHFARHGEHGKGSNRTGADSPDVIVVVPVGTVVKDAGTGEIIADLTSVDQEVIAARGGRGGQGNAKFATATRQAPRFAQPGEPGEEKTLLLELKLLADVGIIGMPNVGKSTFISRVSAARPKIADYPFTTLVPNLGVVSCGEGRSFVIADIPGLVEGAHEGVGMGIRFLRHVERTRVLFHILDLSREPYEGAGHDFEVVNRELARFSPEMIEKPQIVGVNKIDLPVSRERLKNAVDFFAEKGIRILPFSAATGEGLPEILKTMMLLLQETDTPERRGGLDEGF